MTTPNYRDADTAYVGQDDPAAFPLDYLGRALPPERANPCGDSPAYLSGGRWVVSCPTCHYAALACRADPVQPCPTCRTWWTTIWPDPDVEAEALARLSAAALPEEARTWFPWEG